MGEVHIPPTEKILPTQSEIALGLADGLPEAVNRDTTRPGAYQKIMRGELLPVARFIGCSYMDHNLVTPDEARKLLADDPSYKVIPIMQWYETLDL